MRNRALPVVFIIAIAITMLAPLSGQGDPATHRVVGVHGGDLAALSDIGTVRLIGVQIPVEWTREARAFMSGLLLDRTVRLEYDAIRINDQGQTRGYLYLEDGRLANLEIVRMGYAHAFLQFPFRELERFRAAATEARDANRGVWAAGLRGTYTIDPITPAGTRSSPTASTAAPARPAQNTRAQCAATTQRGTRCSRLAQPGRAFCWQH